MRPDREGNALDYEQLVEAFYASILRPGDVAVDCGAHTGRHTAPMQRLVGPGGHVHAFEPLPTVFATLEQLCGDAANVSLYNLALGTEAGTQPFVFVPDFPEYSGFRERVYHAEGLRRDTISVEVRRLDAVIPTTGIRYIKIDAEGGDLLILRGAERILADSRPYVTFEFGDNSVRHYDHNAADCFDFFAARNYVIADILGVPLDRAGFIESSAAQRVWDYVASPATA